MKPDVVVDVGNSRIKWGRCADDQVQEMCSLPPGNPEAWHKQFLDWNLHAGQRWALAGVHPARLQAQMDWLVKHDCRIWWRFESSKRIPVEVCVESPEQVGLDRLFNAAAVNLRGRPGQPAVIVDAGSAVTVDYLDEQGRFQGGAIFPGLRLMAQALNTYTAKLPVVEVERRLRPPEKSTERAIELGVLHAVLGGIELLIRDLTAQALEPLPIYFAGGDAALLAPCLPWPVTIWPQMTLEGIRIAAEASRAA